MEAMYRIEWRFKHFSEWITQEDCGEVTINYALGFIDGAKVTIKNEEIELRIVDNKTGEVY